MNAANDTESISVVADRLADFLRARVGATGKVTISGLRRSGTGSSRENWPFDASWTEPDGQAALRELLLRRDPAAAVVDTGRSVEFALLRALETTDVPAPRVHWLDDTGDELLRPSMVIERYAGDAHRGVLRDKNPLGLTAEQRASIARQLCELLAGVHAVDVVDTGISGVLPNPGANPAEHELAVWEGRLSAAELEPQPELRWTLHWLRDNIPPPPTNLSLVHGDFRPANVLIRDGEIEVLLDWELARLGDPLDDLGWYCTPLYSTEHFIPAVWERQDFLRRYTELCGRRVDSEALRFWQTLAIFRLAVIALQGVRGFCADGADRPAAPAKMLVQRALASTTETV